MSWRVCPPTESLPPCLCSPHFPPLDSEVRESPHGDAFKHEWPWKPILNSRRVTGRIKHTNYSLCLYKAGAILRPLRVAHVQRHILSTVWWYMNSEKPHRLFDLHRQSWQSRTSIMPQLSLVIKYIYSWDVQLLWADDSPCHTAQLNKRQWAVIGDDILGAAMMYDRHSLTF